MAPSRNCAVCGKLRIPGERIVNRCKCPWHLPFSQWPPTLLRTIQAMVYGGPREA